MSIKEGQLVYLYGGERASYLILYAPGRRFSTHLGEVILPPKVSFGDPLTTNTGRKFYLLKPTTSDLAMKVRRTTTIIYPKDAGWLALALDLKPGMKVIEIGTGSGAFTILLAQLVGKEGKVYTFDRRKDFLENALKNIKRAGLLDRVVASQLEAGEDFPVKNVDAVFLDLPEPWIAVKPAWEALLPGRPLASILPTCQQLQQMVKSLKENKFGVIKVIELLERKILVREKEGVRPFERMVGFTGYLISARKLI